MSSQFFQANLCAQFGFLGTLFLFQDEVKIGWTSEKLQGLDTEWERQNSLKGFPCWAEKGLQYTNLLCFDFIRPSAVASKKAQKL